MNPFFSKYKIGIVLISIMAIASVVAVWSFGDYSSIEYIAPGNEEATVIAPSTSILPPPLVHIPTPASVRAVYMTSWVAGTPSFRENLLEFVRSSEVNAIVIDVKDYTGKVAFRTGDPQIEQIGSEEVRVPDMPRLIEDIHKDNIYTIARISVFQDPYMSSVRPEIAVQTTNGSVWKDRKGISWIDPASRDMWEYTVLIARAAEAAGFDELNFDYVRFPSDGNMQDIAFPVWDNTTERSDVLEEFFAYIHEELADLSIPISLDLFGMTMTNTDDLNIGQVLEKAALYADYIAPMVYPSHYPTMWNGIKNPAAKPYEVIYYAMTEGERRLETMRLATTSTSSPLYGKKIATLRPWIQDFDLGAEYTIEMILAQKKAVYDAGLNSWMSWDPKNLYTKDAYQSEL